MKLSLCRFCIVRFFWFWDEGEASLRNIIFCVSDRVAFVAKITNVSSAVCG